MRNILLMPTALGDIGWWVQHDIKILKKIYQLLENTAKTPFEGLGQPEPLKANYAGYWSRRITKEHRMVYKVEDRNIIVHSLHRHYEA